MAPRTGRARGGPVTTDTAADLLTITESQQGLLVVDELVPTPELYNQVTRFDLDPTVTLAAIAVALSTVVAVQPSLRQVFGRLPHPHARLTDPPALPELPLEHLEVAPADFEQAVRELSGRVGRTPFALAARPAYRFGYVRTTDGTAATMLLCTHHIVGDGVSLAAFRRDLESALTDPAAPDAVQALRERRELAFRKELEAQQRSSASAQTTDRVKEWAERLREVPPLVLDPRPGRPTETAFSGARVSFTLDEADSAAFRDTCKRLKISPFVLLTGVYGAVLARHGGVSTVLVGSPFTARRTIRAFDLCGFFVNTLPVTVEVDWARSVDTHLGEVVRDAVDFCRGAVDVSFNQLVAHARPDRTGTRNPLFSCMLAMQDTIDTVSGGAITRVREMGNGTAKFDLWLGATRVDERWLLEVEYDRELIAPEVADGLLDSLRAALHRAITDGSRPLADLFEDASALASLRTDGFPAVVPSATLAGWIGATAACTAEAVAVEDPAGTLTYGALDAAAGRLAGALAAHGIKPGDVVGLALDTLADTATAILAVLRVGGVYLPLDRTLPVDRLRYMVGRADCRLVLGTVPEQPGVRVAGLDDLPAGAAPSVGTAATGGYISFTSGSTGQPKGVRMGEPALLNLTGWQFAALDMTPRTRFLQYAPLGFDVSFQEIVPTLAAGGTVVSREPADRRDFAALVERVADTRVTHVYLPVAALRPFVHSAQRRGTLFPALRHVCVSGEQLMLDEQIHRFFIDHPHCRLTNLYGPTETQAVTTYRRRGTDVDWPAHAPIGMPLAGVAAYVVDATGHLAPAGVPGELHLGGRCVADGYAGDSERTAAGFLPDRFVAGPAAVMYRTGDQVVRRPHGELVFLGRNDNQVKIRGNRVELGELEAVANAVPGVREAVAVVRGTGADRELVLFLVAERTGGGAVDHEEVRAALGRALPAYMVPARCFDVDLVPVSGTGKTDRAALAALAEELVSQRAAEPAPRVEHLDELERGLAAIWAEILGVEGIARDRSLLEYGAHSLNMFTAFARIDERYGVSVPMLAFFRSPTIATLGDLVRAGQGPAVAS
ncbi:amino acid adenylation domain-containing protein [Dactylosporangium matsuzakiense]|nr:amino acid adenylation domain-containing protein [Dactylosporangium matsuzakiense]